MGRALSRAVALTLALGTALAPARPLLADESPSVRIRRRLSDGLKLFQDLEYRNAIRQLSPLRSDGAATRAQRLSALEIIGISHLILGQKPLAIEAFEDLLAIDPGYQLQHDDGSPKIRKFFEDTRAAYLPGFDGRAGVQLELSVPPGATAAHQVEIEALVKAGVGKVASIILHWRRRGVLAYGEVAMRAIAADRHRAVFTPPPSRERYVIDYYVEAQNVAGRALGRSGGPENPLALDVAPGSPDERGTSNTRWFILAGGVVAAGITTAIILGSRDDSTPDGTLDPGRVSLAR